MFGLFGFKLCRRHSTNFVGSKDVQLQINIAYDYSEMERYELQPTKKHVITNEH
jgi:hypothetical protein